MSDVTDNRDDCPPPMGEGESEFELLEALGPFTHREWRALNAPLNEESEVLQAAIIEEGLVNHFRSILNAETLIVLAGSGTSLGIIQSDGQCNAPSMNSLWNDVKSLPEFSSISNLLDADIVATENLEHVLSNAQTRNAVIPNSDLEDFISQAEKVILRRCSFIDEHSNVDSHEVFLRKVARRSVRLQRTQIFTTNYDLAFEMAARRARFHIIDGFGYEGRNFDGGSFDLDYVRRRPHEQLALEPSVFHLLKLHGSVDWSGAGSNITKVNAEPEIPVLIYPSASKYQLSYRQPYLEFMSRFQVSLRQPDVGLIVVGFGFNDAHLNAPIEAALRGNIGLRAVFVTPGARADSRSDSLEWVEDLIYRGDRRLGMFTGKFDDLVKYLPDTPQSEERDEHLDRISPHQGGGLR